MVRPIPERPNIWRDMGTTAFPKNEIRLMLADWWDEYTRPSLQHVDETPQRLAGVSVSYRLRSRQKPGNVFDVQPVVSAAEALIPLSHLKPLLGFGVGSEVVRRDGYNSKEEFVGDLCSQLETEFAAHSAKAAVPKKPVWTLGRSR